jgi:hypothetical protein
MTPPITKLPAPQIKLRQKSAHTRNFYNDLPLSIRRNIVLFLIADQIQLIEIVTTDATLFDGEFYWKEFCTAISLEFSKVQLPGIREFVQKLKNVKKSDVLQLIQATPYGVASRQLQLTRALSEVGLRQRPDSKLCVGWISGKLDPSWNLQRVVNMCCEMEWLYRHTNYARNLRRALDRARDEMYDTGGDDSDDEYREFDYNSIEATVRAQVLKINPVPVKLPWLKAK